MDGKQVRFPKLRKLGCWLDDSKLNLRVVNVSIDWHALGQWVVLCLYFLYWLVVILGALCIACFALTVTWNVGPSRLLGWNSLAYHETMSIFAFTYTVWLVHKGYKAIKKRLANAHV